MDTSAAEELLQPEQPESSTKPPRLSRLECLGGVIVSPLKTFEYLAEKPQWFLPLAIILLYVLMNFVLSMTVMSVVSMMTMAETMDGAAASFFSPLFVVFFTGINLMMSALIALTVFFSMVGALYAIIRIFKIKPGFYALASTLAFAEFVPRLAGSILKEVIPQLTGSGQIFAPDLPTGIAPIFSEFDVPIIAQALIDRIELFHLWSFALVAIGVRFAAKISSERAMLVALIYWAVCILAVAGIGYTGGLFASLMGFY